MFYWYLSNRAKRVGLRNENGKQKIKSRRRYFVFVRVWVCECVLRGKNVTPVLLQYRRFSWNFFFNFSWISSAILRYRLCPISIRKRIENKFNVCIHVYISKPLLKLLFETKLHRTIPLTTTTNNLNGRQKSHWIIFILWIYLLFFWICYACLYTAITVQMLLTSNLLCKSYTKTVYS